MNLIIIGLAFATFLSTLLGGAFAIKFKKVLPYFFAFAAGSLISVTFFDILPESLEVSASANLPARYLMITVVASFLFYSFLEKYFLTHHHKESEGHGHIMGPIGAGSLVIHSFLDGIAIGAAYQIDSAVGLIVALAVIFHDFTDGINTVTLMLKNKHHVKNAMKFLVMDALAPVLGISLTLLISINQAILSLILAGFAGEFLYIGAVNLLPETYKYPNWKMFLSIIMGVLLILGLTSII
ncbi:MAG TPA: ZIP family metal transporter [archaeon]|nr:ZIP family metal transporter [archaeon]